MREAVRLAAEAARREERTESALGKAGLLRSQVDARAAEYTLPQEFEVIAGHGRGPRSAAIFRGTRAARDGPIFSIGRISRAAPSAAAALGMP